MKTIDLGNPLQASLHSILLKELCAESSIFIDKESSKGSTFHVTDKMHTLVTTNKKALAPSPHFTKMKTNIQKKAGLFPFLYDRVRIRIFYLAFSLLSDFQTFPFVGLLSPLNSSEYGVQS